MNEDQPADSAEVKPSFLQFGPWDVWRCSRSVRISSEFADLEIDAEGDLATDGNAAWIPLEAVEAAIAMWRRGSPVKREIIVQAERPDGVGWYDFAFVKTKAEAFAMVRAEREQSSPRLCKVIERTTTAVEVALDESRE